MQLSLALYEAVNTWPEQRVVIEAFPKPKYLQSILSRMTDTLQHSAAIYAYTQWLRSRPLPIVYEHYCAFEGCSVLSRVTESILQSAQPNEIIKTGDIGLVLTVWSLCQDEARKTELEAGLFDLAESVHADNYVWYEPVGKTPNSLLEWQAGHNLKLFKDACQQAIEGQEHPARCLRVYWGHFSRRAWAKQVDIQKHLLWEWTRIVSVEPLADMRNMLRNGGRSWGVQSYVTLDIGESLWEKLKEIVQERAVSQMAAIHREYERATSAGKRLALLLQLQNDLWILSTGDLRRFLLGLTEMITESDIPQLLAFTNQLVSIDALEERHQQYIREFLQSVASHRSAGVLIDALFESHFGDAVRGIVEPVIERLCRGCAAKLPGEVLKRLASSSGYADEARELATDELRRRSLPHVSRMTLETLVRRWYLCRPMLQDAFSRALQARLEVLVVDVKLHELQQLFELFDVKTIGARGFRDAEALPWSVLFEHADALALQVLSSSPNDPSVWLKAARTMYTCKGRDSCLAYFMKLLGGENKIEFLSRIASEVARESQSLWTEFSQSLCRAIGQATTDRCLTEDEVFELLAVPTPLISEGLVVQMLEALNNVLPDLPFTRLLEAHRLAQCKWEHWGPVLNEVGPLVLNRLPDEIERIQAASETVENAVTELIVLYGLLPDFAKSRFSDLIKG